MKMNKFKALFLFASAAIAMCSCSSSEDVTANYRVIPLPQSIETVENAAPFHLTSSTVIAYPQGDSTLLNNANFLEQYIFETTGKKLAVKEGTDNDNAIVLLASLDNDNKDAYQITVNDKQIVIDGASAAGNFYGIQTIRKSIPKTGDNLNVLFPAATIKDQPRFAYRGVHLDVSRHMFPVDSIKTYIDMLALHNINKLHWHISDDQGWRIEIKNRPELVEKGSMRKGTQVGKHFGLHDSIPYGGYYTQEEARDIVKYAADRHITVIPEIDMPGHMLGALTAYPELGCTGGPYEVWTEWGVSEDILCASNEDVYKFVDDVLKEIVDIFPSEYIHLGGDEAPKVRWEKCPKCQAKIKELGYKTDSHSTAEQKLQTYYMSRVSEILTKYGRKMIGWDEILEGGLTPGAVIMSWRGFDGAEAAAKAGHDAIMTPTSFCYFDYCQSPNQSEEPLGIGGYVPVRKVYEFEPISPQLNAEEAKHILGAQANMWTEYIKDFSHLQYMLIPRLAALCEVQWVEPEQKDYIDFTHRLPQLINIYNMEGWNYAKHILDVEGAVKSDAANKCAMVELSTVDNSDIRYTLDGTEPNENSSLYEEPIKLDSTCVIKAVAMRPNGKSKIYSDSVLFGKTTFKPVTLLSEPHPRYGGRGATMLNDGKLGMIGYNSGEWMGFYNEDLVVVFDLEQTETVSHALARVLAEVGSWIFDATGMKVEVSTDGNIYKEVASEKYQQLTDSYMGIINHELTFAPVEARYVKVTVFCEKQIPNWFTNGAGAPSFVFCDEIAVW